MTTEKLTILLAGASGVFGREITTALTGAGHTVIGLGRAAANGVPADLLDRDGLLRAVAGTSADAVVHAATALKRPPLRHRDMAATDQLRILGTRNLLAAAREVGATRFIAESMVFGYGYGDHGDTPLAETDGWAPVQRDPALEQHVAAMRTKEELMLGAGGIALRYGLFYGGAGTDAMVQMLRKRMLPLPADGGRALPWVTLADASAAIVAALEHGRPGQAYNIADDAAVGFREMAELTAEVFGAPAPMRVPRWVPGMLGYLSVILSTNLRVDSGLAHRELHWRPSHDGARAALAEQA
ncbi:nucleoside-diphosphate-sugar epimerase [Allocatelliglobosispora scoriae]|uniref:Nucleoside-diphosphate-sugar epimerase n=1 Tax=Allocatelliglobosispora scoriae TaxID=643052 RepID=A0A841BIZ6_9ACTN|nr:NAD(P)-dependent oxidoreductase [Allocatelliglobosispora scoriae]MBB5867166.1 nucleoside-diphosphate-sugar epimerase [Allocatelliglobosispora scoriae]